MNTWRMGLLVVVALAAQLRIGNDAAPRAVSVVVLGTAQDGGLPQSGCDCSRCDRARRRPSTARMVASLAIVNERLGRTYLIDASPDVGRQLALVARTFPAVKHPRRRPVDGILLTHAHAGHVAGLLQFGREAIAPRELPLHGTEAMLDFLRGNAPWSLLVDAGHLAPQALVAGEPFQLDDDVSIVAHVVPHRGEFTDTVAFEVRGPKRRLLYVPDIDRWEKWDRSLVDVVASIDVALLDGTFHDAGELPDRKLEDIPHPLIPHTIELLGAVGKGKVWFTHLNHSNAAADTGSTARRSIERAGYAVAADGQVFPL